MYDLAIIGGGAAGLTAAIYAARAGLNFTVLEQDGWGGGQITSAHTVENYPGAPRMRGADLGDALKEQAEALGAEIVLAKVERICVSDTHKEIVLHDGEPVSAKAVIAATGAEPRKLNVTGEQHLLGRGVSYCAVCDGAFFTGKSVFVIGGGDTAVEDAIYLSSVCKHVTLVHRREHFRAAKTRVDALLKLQNVTVRCNETLQGITGTEKVDGVVLQSGESSRHCKADGVFIAVGRIPVTDYLADLALKTENGYVLAGEDCKTGIDGLFVAGDIRKKQLRQIVTAAADGANAVYSALAYLQQA